MPVMTDGDRRARQQVLCLLRVVWRGIDWTDPLWRDPRVAWDRFAGRIRAAATSGDLGEFMATLARKCHVSAPQMDDDALDALNNADEARCMRVISRDVELLVGLLRKERADAKAERMFQAERKKQTRDNPLFSHESLATQLARDAAEESAMNAALAASTEVIEGE